MDIKRNVHKEFSCSYLWGYRRTTMATVDGSVLEGTKIITKEWSGVWDAMRDLGDGNEGSRRAMRRRFLRALAEGTLRPSGALSSCMPPPSTHPTIPSHPFSRASCGDGRGRGAPPRARHHQGPLRQLARGARRLHGRRVRRTLSSGGSAAWKESRVSAASSSPTSPSALPCGLLPPLATPACRRLRLYHFTRWTLMHKAALHNCLECGQRLLAAAAKPPRGGAGSVSSAGAGGVGKGQGERGRG